ncbi:hypothetical protein ROZALSC1DRAFT_23784 [Rozella allomycis CSF55]|uniref:Coiled-coil domain-containing protein 39 n=1 Tax=Rozella allomycis (strain CSF55) TaxID=988480 RepID=A0A4P9YEP9_ROZAC|nr:hypothetical protein ROZALSC1DRAFT_23784 [Rozella allomycis CSF55]
MFSLENFTDLLPPFADEQSKQLDLKDKIKQKHAEMQKLEHRIEEQKRRRDLMKEHMKNIRTEFGQCQSLKDAKKREMDTENNLRQIAERQIGRMHQEMRRLLNEIDGVTGHINNLQRNIHQSNENIEKMRQSMKMSKEELDEWLKIQNEKEEDMMAMAKYSRQDDTRIKEIMLKLEKMLGEVHKKKQELSLEVTETQAVQIELAKTTEMFHSLHNERQQLIKRWENLIANFTEKDADIESKRNEVEQLQVCEPESKF